MIKLFFLSVAVLIFSNPALSQNKRPALSQLDFEEGSAKTPRNIETEKVAETSSAPFAHTSPPITSPVNTNIPSPIASTETATSKTNEPLNSILEAQSSLAETVKERFKEVESLLEVNSGGKNSFSSRGTSDLRNERINKQNTHHSSRMQREKGRGVPILHDKPKNVGVPRL